MAVKIYDSYSYVAIKQIKKYLENEENKNYLIFILSHRIIVFDEKLYYAQTLFHLCLNIDESNVQIVARYLGEMGRKCRKCRNCTYSEKW